MLDKSQCYGLSILIVVASFNISGQSGYGFEVCPTFSCLSLGAEPGQSPHAIGQERCQSFSAQYSHRISEVGSMAALFRGSRSILGKWQNHVVSVQGTVYKAYYNSLYSSLKCSAYVYFGHLLQTEL